MRKIRGVAAVGVVGALALMWFQPAEKTTQARADQATTASSVEHRDSARHADALAQTVPDWEFPQAEQTVVGDYRPHERLVRFEAGADVDAVVAQHGAELLRAPGRSGYALVTGPAGALEALAGAPETQLALPHATTKGSGNVRHRVRPLEDYQWYIDEIDPTLPGAFGSRQQAFDYVYPLSDFVVAVIDTGVAYGANAPAGLANNRVVAPYDFVNDDPDAFDDHQHGTHIASLIASDGVHGAIEGIAPAVGLMPIKVLDQNNEGVELDLIEGIHHAVANGADIINMSLSFGEGYRPSQALLEALQAAHDAGIIMVGAAGNDGADYISWPAASPLVIAVGASTKFGRNEGLHRYEKNGPAGYTNLGSGMDFMTSGGDLADSGLVQGLPNGILAEAIALNDPSRTGHWLMAGTSQSCAVISGLAAGMLAGNVAPDRIYSALQYHAKHHKISDNDLHRAGEGAGYMDLNWGRNLDPLERYKSLPEDGQRYDPVREYHVGVLPYFAAHSETEVRPAALVSVFNADGTNARGNVTVMANLYGADTGIVDCTTDWTGTCTLFGNPLPELDAEGTPLPHAVVFSVEKVLYRDGRTMHAHPRIAMTTSPDLDALFEAVSTDPSTSDALLAWSFERHADPTLGELAPAFSVVDNGGTGLASLPLGLVMSPSLIDRMGSSQDGMLNANGHDVPMQLIDLDGSGLMSIPLSLRDVRLVTFKLGGVGLKSLPLGLHPKDAHGGGEKVVPVSKLEGTSLTTALAAHLYDGGFTVSGYGAASILGSSSTVAISPNFVAELDGMGAGSASVPPEIEALANTGDTDAAPIEDEEAVDECDQPLAVEVP